MKGSINTGKQDSCQKSEIIKLKREIGLLEGVSLIVCSIIGSGIFISPKGIFTLVGSPGASLLVWVLGGVFAICGAMTMMELQLAMPTSGGYYTFFFEVLGPLPAFIYLWVQVFILAPSHYAILGLAVAKYITSAVFCSAYEIPPIAIQLIAACAVLFFVFLNCFDVRIIARLQRLFLFGKLVPLAFIILFGLSSTLLCDTKAIYRAVTFGDTIFEPGKVVYAIYYAGFAYGGWDSLVSITEEIKNPNRNMPLSVYLSIPLVTFVYILTNIAYLLVLTPEEFISSDATALTFIEKIHKNYGWIMSIFVSLSIIGTLSLNILVSSRQLFVGARNGQFLQAMGLIKQSRLTPVPALIFLGTLSMSYLFFTQDIFLLINYVAYIFNLNYIGILGIFFYLRWKKPDLIRPVKVSIIHPIVFSFSILFMTILPIFTNPLQVGTGIGIALTGIPVYLLFFDRNGVYKDRKALNALNGKFTQFIQKLFLCLPED